MTQRIFPFLHSPVNADEFLQLFDAEFRDGVLDGSQATTGSGSWNVTIKAGKTVIGGSWVHDDLDKIDALNLGHVAGTDAHFVVYQTYSYVDSDPPASSVFAVTAGVAPPTQPTIPAGAVRLCDIFVPAAAANIGTVGGGNQADPVQVSTTGVRFVQAPRLWATQDTAELVDRLALAAGHTMIYTAGAIDYNDGAGTLALTQSVVVQTLATTNRHRFQNAPAFVRATIPATGGSPLSVPGSAGVRDVVVYTVVDRTVPTEALAATVKFLNRSNPAAAELNELMNYANRTSIIILGVIIGSKLHMPGIAGGALPTPDADNRKFLRNSNIGSHSWELVLDTNIVGGHMIVADNTARNAIPADQRKLGMLVYSIASARWYTLLAGILDANWVVAFDDQHVVGGLHCVADNTARDAIHADYRKQGMVVYSLASESFYALIGGTANGNWALLQDDSRHTGGFRVVANNAAKLAIPLLRQKVGMLVLQLDTLEVFRLTVANAGSPTYVGAFKFSVSANALILDGNAASMAITNGTVKGGTLIPISAAFAEAAAHVPHSHVAWGVECIPDLENLGGAFGPQARILPGRCVTYSGVMLEIATEKVAEAPDNVNAAVGAFSAGPANIYIFVTHGANRSQIFAQWSHLPPDAFGRPTGTITVNTADDYCYVGMLRYQDNNAGDWRGVWGDFAVSYTTAGTRECVLSSEEGAGMTGQTALTNKSNTDNSDALVSPADPSALFPTARQLIFALSIFIDPDTGAANAISVTMFGGGFRLIVGTHDEETGIGSQVVRIANRSEAVNVKCVTGGGYTGTIDYTVTGRIIGIVENVNNIVPVDDDTAPTVYRTQDEFGF